MNSTLPLKTWLVDNFITDITPDQLEDDLDLIDSGVIDSLRLLRLISWVSDTYEIPMDEVPLSPDNFRSVAAIRAFVAEAKDPAAA